MKYYENKIKKIKYDGSIKRIEELRNWFAYEYINRLHHIQRCNFLGIKPDESEFALQKEAYDREQELRLLLSIEPLDEIKYKDII